MPFEYDIGGPRRWRTGDGGGRASSAARFRFLHYPPPGLAIFRTPGSAFAQLQLLGGLPCAPDTLSDPTHGPWASIAPLGALMYQEVVIAADLRSDAWFAGLRGGRDGSHVVAPFLFLPGGRD